MFSICFSFGPHEIGITNDIALLKLEETVSSSLSIPLCQKSYKDSGYPLAVCGLGRTQFSPAKHPKVLQEAIMMETTSDRCELDGSKQICLIPQPGRDQSACRGDSGGPVFPLSKSGDAICVYGVVSYGDFECKKFDVHARVSSYINWIEQNTCCSQSGLN